jgi:hypothetical protein
MSLFQHRESLVFTKQKMYAAVLRQALIRKLYMGAAGRREDGVLSIPFGGPGILAETLPGGRAPQKPALTASSSKPPLVNKRRQ